ncbi:MAG: cation:proton antiporter [Candidatus Eremiobacteraeota bacterium]|nr:cation:proton antiporter [Candidatus Eremiobacteraeota bacterium]
MTLLVVAGLLTLAWILSIGSIRFRVPDVLGFLVLGIVFGEFGLRVIHVNPATPVVGTIIGIAASVILYECGRGLDLEHLRASWRGLMLLVTGGVLVTSGLSAIAAHAIFGWDWQTAILLGTVLAATDPAAVIPVMRHAGVAARVSNVAQAESALNDATGAILAVVTLQIVQSGTLSVPATISSFAIMGLGGLGIGIAVAAITAWVAHGEHFGALDLGAHNQQVIELITVLLTYGIATYVGSSGYMAAFAAGVVHSRTITRAAYSTQPFFSTLSFFARLAVFVILGANFNPGAAVFPVVATIGFLLAFMLVIRPIAVFSSLWADRDPPWRLNELLMMSWVRETGVISAALAAGVAALAIPNAEAIVAKTAVVIVATVVIQGLTTGTVARALGEASAPLASQT